MRYQGLIFDFDGTIADTLLATLRIYNDLAADSGFRHVEMEDVARLRDMDARAVLDHLNIPKRRVPLLLAKGRRMLKRDLTTIPLIDGIKESLPLLREGAECFGILTSNATENVETFLEIHGLRHLFTFISSTSTLSGKSTHLRSIARTFSMNPSQLLYIGDEIRDIRASRKAGIDIAAVTWGFNSRDSLAAENPRHLIDTTAQLLAIVGGPAEA
ncbi:MAG: HAD hydrolase-like protein [Verrucomicrobia bacterium]|nr:HAD hydrolase-like protein [Verrucomicrobiota bacterium]